MITAAKATNKQSSIEMERRIEGRRKMCQSRMKRAQQLSIDQFGARAGDD
jgi:hypothetical protein